MGLASHYCKRGQFLPVNRSDAVLATKLIGRSYAALSRIKKWSIVLAQVYFHIPKQKPIVVFYAEEVEPKLDEDKILIIGSLPAVAKVSFQMMSRRVQNFGMDIPGPMAKRSYDKHSKHVKDAAVFQTKESMRDKRDN